MGKVGQFETKEVFIFKERAYHEGLLWNLGKHLAGENYETMHSKATTDQICNSGPSFYSTLWETS